MAKRLVFYTLGDSAGNGISFTEGEDIYIHPRIGEKIYAGTFMVNDNGIPYIDTDEFHEPFTGLDD